MITSKTTPMEIKDNTFLRQFEVTINDQLLSIEYSLQERKIFLTKLNVPDNFDNEEIINEFLISVLEIIKEQNIKVVPTAVKIVKFFRKNPSYKEMLPVGIVI